MSHRQLFVKSPRAPKPPQGYSQNFAAERDQFVIDERDLDRFLMSLQVDSQRKLPQSKDSGLEHQNQMCLETMLC